MVHDTPLDLHDSRQPEPTIPYKWDRLLRRSLGLLVSHLMIHDMLIVLPILVIVTGLTDPILTRGDGRST